VEALRTRTNLPPLPWGRGLGWGWRLAGWSPASGCEAAEPGDREADSW